MILRQQPALVVVLRELEENKRGTEQDGDDAGQVGPLVARQERLLRRSDDLRLYCGYCSATSAAPANDIVSWFCTLVVKSALGGASASAAAAAAA